MHLLTNKRHTLPIFILYMATSIIFLTVFSVFFYISQRHNVLESEAYYLESVSKDIQYKLRSGNFIDINPPDGVSLNLIENKSGAWLSMDFKEIDFINFRRDVVISGDEIYYKDDFKQRGYSYTLILKKSGFKDKLFSLRIKISIVYIFTMVLFFIIAYFIVQLSFRPLFAKISELNSFISDTTHEIKTPLSVILMSLEMMDKNPKKYLSNIQTATKTISNLYDDLVALNLENKDNALIKIDITNLVKQRVFYFDELAKQKGLSFSLNLSEVSFNTDAVKFSKIIDNLISNAIKYSYENSEISIILTKNSLSIENSGETIRAKDISKIYEKFTRFNSEKGGFGIGLSLVHKYTTELGYKIICQSENKKTKFTVEF